MSATAYMSSHVTSATMICYAEVLFQSVNTLLAERETSIASVDLF